MFIDTAGVKIQMCETGSANYIRKQKLAGCEAG